MYVSIAEDNLLGLVGHDSKKPSSANFPNDTAECKYDR